MTPTFSVSCGDAVNWLRSLFSSSVDLVITDPPYESLEKHRKVGTTTRLKHSNASSNDWFEIFPNARFADLFDEVYRVLVPNAHFYMMCDQETMFVARPIAERAGFVFAQPIVWDKLTMGMGYHYRARYEFVLMFEKGERPTTRDDVADVIAAKRIRNGYPTEKPPAVAEVLIEQSSAPGELVIDPFMGSGSTGVAAIRAGRVFAGNDLRATSLDITRSRLRELGAEETR